MRLCVCDRAGGLEKLRDANIRSLMVTGDNLLTALSVAQESGMIDVVDDVILAQTRLPGDDGGGGDDAEAVTKPTLNFSYAEGYSPCKTAAAAAADRFVSVHTHTHTHAWKRWRL